MKPLDLHHALRATEAAIVDRKRRVREKLGRGDPIEDDLAVIRERKSHAKALRAMLEGKAA